MQVCLTIDLVDVVFAKRWSCTDILYSARIVKIYEGILLLVENQGVQFVIAAILKNRCYEIESGGIFEVITQSFSKLAYIII